MPPEEPTTASSQDREFAFTVGIGFLLLAGASLLSTRTGVLPAQYGRVLAAVSVLAGVLGLLFWWRTTPG